MRKDMETVSNVVITWQKLKSSSLSLKFLTRPLKSVGLLPNNSNSVELMDHLLGLEHFNMQLG